MPEKDMVDDIKWKAAARSNDPTELESMLRLCRNHEAKYAEQMLWACWEAYWHKQWKNLTKIIEAMCMDLDRFQQDISNQISRAIYPLNVPCLAAVLDGIAGKMNQMLTTVGTVILTINMANGPDDYPGCAEKIHEHVTHAALKELSAVAMIKSKEERLAALDACLQRRHDWPQGIIEKIARFTLEFGEYNTLEILLEMEPSIRDGLRRQTVKDLGENLFYAKIDDIKEQIRIFDISAAEVDDALKYAVDTCIKYGLTWESKEIISFLDSKPQEYRPVVDAAVKGYNQKDAVLLAPGSRKCHQLFQEWITAVESC